MGMPNVLKHFATFIDGTSYVGEVQEIVPPKLTRKMEEFRAGGMRMPVDIDHGNEKLEAELTAGGWLKEVLKQYGKQTVDGVPLRFAGAAQRDDTGEYMAIEMHMRGRWSEIDPGSGKSGEASEFKAKMSLNYYRLVVDGEEVLEMDAIHMIEKTGGVDLMEKVRSILGI